MMTQEKTYNGYTNYETWNIMLWLYNDENNYNYLRMMIPIYMRCGMKMGDLQYVIRRIFHNGKESVTPDSVNIDDKKIDWPQLKRHIRADFKEDGND